jgi:hypothetical protein
MALFCYITSPNVMQTYVVTYIGAHEICGNFRVTRFGAFPLELSRASVLSDSHELALFSV